jgi:uncharacterized coiled-coil protein SlyX
MANDQRLQEAEIKIAFLEQLTADLSAALAQAARIEADLQHRLDAVERAVKALATRVPAPKDDVANAAEDPVPSSG